MKRWAIESEIASGGMGTLHRGRDRETGEAVAIKLLKAIHAEDVTLLQRFLREGRTLSELSHPNIVRVRDFGEEGGGAFMVLDLVDGDTLEKVIAREGALPAARAVHIADEVLDALATCHEHDVVHRDVKPANVMLEGDVVKLIDFGLAKVSGRPLDKLTETGTVHGTPHYMAPEQCRGEDVGPAADVYSLGVVLYEMLAGRTPFVGNDAATYMAQHLFVDPPPLANVQPGVAAAVLSALAKRPEDRPAARALRERLAAAMTGTDSHTRAYADASTRVEHLARPREDRAIGTYGAVSATTVVPVVVWLDGDRTGAILGCLGTAGLACTHESRDTPPEANAVVVTRGLDRVKRLRDRNKKTPIIVIDIAGPEETSAAIRAGADDMLLLGAPEANLAAKVRRLAKRVRA